MDNILPGRSKLRSGISVGVSFWGDASWLRASDFTRSIFGVDVAGGWSLACVTENDFFGVLWDRDSAGANAEWMLMGKHGLTGRYELDHLIVSGHHARVAIDL